MIAVGQTVYIVIQNDITKAAEIVSLSFKEGMAPLVGKVLYETMEEAELKVLSLSSEIYSPIIQ
jgi:hypothetical protein